MLLFLPSLARAWEVRIDGTGTSFDQAHAVAIDANGDVISAGRFHDATRLFDFLVTKHSGVTGAESWRRVAFGNGGNCNCGIDERAWGVALTPSGDAFTAGYLHYKTVFQQFAVMRLGFDDGLEAWRALFGDGRSYFLQQDEALSVAADGAGDVLAAGVFVGIDGPFGVVMKLAGISGAPLWTVSTGLPPMQGVAVDSSGDVIGVGHGLDFFVVVKLAGANGGPIWRRDLPFPMPGYGSAESVAVDSTGDVIAAGRRGIAGAYVIKLERDTGETVWEREVVSAGGSAQVNEVAVHGSGDVIAAGQFAQDGTGFAQLSVMRLAAATGNDVWPQFLVAGTGSTAEARDVALDSAGDIVVTGTLVNPASSGHFEVLKLAGSTGIQQWRRELDKESANDVADDVAIDTAGNVIAAGALGTDFAVVKLRGNDGADFPPCGDVTLDQIVDTTDFYALRSSLAGLPPGLPAPGRCSVIGGPVDCDILDAVVIRRSQFQLQPGLQSVCADAVE